MPPAPEPIAIVGLGCVFPGAPSAEVFWKNLVGGVDAIREAPASRLDPVFFEGSAEQPDRFYCRRGGFLTDEAVFDPLAFGVMPRAAEGAEPDQLLTLTVAQQALADAGLTGDGAWRQRTAFVLGRGGYLTPGLVRLDQRIRTAQQLVEVLRAQLPDLNEAQLKQVKVAFQAQLGPYGPDTAIGLVPNLAASRTANRLDLQGPAYTVDAACASSLVALDQACRELWSGRCDVALAGGVHVCQDVTFWSVFTQLGALSHAQQIRPFDRRADGLLIGEGAGLVVLQRLADARRDGRRVYARVLGVGLSSDGRGTTLMNPRVEGQLLALERAWAAADIDPATVAMIEAHGTGTEQGDTTELTTLGRFFGSGLSPAALGSVKSMIGHAMPAAGAAGLIKTALALHHGTVPPSLHCEEPHALLEKGRFHVPGEAEDWAASEKRRAGVNAFGFGGINAHVVLEGETTRSRARRPPAPPPSRGGEPTERPLIIAAAHPQELLAKLDANESQLGPGGLRLALFNPTPERRALARKVVEREKPWREHDDLWFSPRGVLHGGAGAKLAFLFPGIEPTFEPQVDDVADTFGLAAPPAVATAPASGPQTSIEETGLAVVAVSRLLARALDRLGVHPQALAGHSIGEWTGLVVAERIPADFAQPFIDSLAPGTLELPNVLFAMAGCSAEKAAQALQGLDGVALSHDNCPHQVILCGAEGPLDLALARLREAQVLTQKLPFRSGFHSPLFAPFVEPLLRRLSAIPLQPGRVPLWSATTCAPYPEGHDQVRTLIGDHLVHAVRFRELLEALYADGVRAFLQVGAGNGLVGFVEDTLRGRPHFTMTANLRKRSGLAQLRRVLAALYCEGLEVQPFQLSGLRSAPPPLELGVPLVHLPSMLGPVSLGTRDLASASDHSPIATQFAKSFEHVAKAQRDVQAALRGNQSTASRTFSERRKLSLEGHPYLVDHCFYRQPAGWPELSDRFPVVPATLSVDWLREAAAKVGAPPTTTLENVLALRWLAVAPATEVVVRAERTGDSRAAVSIDGYAQGDAVWGNSSTSTWALPAPLRSPAPLPFDAKALYHDRWMFHGPAYQGVVGLDRWSAEGIDGELVVPSAPGALLDNAGQLFGLWVMLSTTADRLALPVRLARVELFGSAPRLGERLRCAVRIQALTEREARANLWLWHVDGRPYCRITDWEDRRFDSDARLWEVLRWPERELLALPRAGGYLFVADAWRQLPSRELLGRRYLGAAERATWEALQSRRQGPWLNGRIAVKDAVRDLLWRRGQGPLFPVEIAVENDPQGRPLVRGPFTGPLHVSLAHTDGAAVAIASAHGPVGIDLEAPRPRPAGFAEALLSEAERGMLPDLDDAWLTRAWTAKEAVAKARGTGLAGNPRSLVITARDGERLQVDGKWTENTNDGPFIVSWYKSPSR